MTHQNDFLTTIKHHGAINGVTGSCHELAVDELHSVLVDCGLFQGDEVSRDGSSLDKLMIDFSISHVKALLVTHCHIDHVGRIPYLLIAGFDGPIICSKPTAKLLPLVLEDAIKIGFTRNAQLVSRVMAKIKKQIIGVDYQQWFDCSAWFDKKSILKIKFKPAGHILGSAYIECNVSRAGKTEKIVFSGDLGAPYTPLLPAPKPPYSCDRLIIESTYGDRLHAPRRDRAKQLKQLIERCLRDKGVILIPAFSIGRTQELLYELEHIIHQATQKTSKNATQWENIEIIVDSPLANQFTQHYRELKMYWDKEARNRLSQHRHPLAFEQLTTIDSHDTHQMTLAYLAKRDKPAIVIAASGMVSGGRILNYVKTFIQDERADILFSGYQAKGTPGRDIQQYADKGGYVILDGERYTIKAQVHTLSGYSAHADQKDLVNFVKRMRIKPKEIRIVHGDDEAKASLKQKFLATMPNITVLAP